MSYPPFPCAEFSQKLLEYIQTVVIPSRPLEERFKQNCLDELENKDGWREERRALKEEVDELKKGYDEMQMYVEELYKQYLYLKLEKDLRVQESYATQVARYRKLGWLVNRKGREGIIGLDKKFYPLPSLDEVREALLEKAEFLTYKYSQGFTIFLLVPFGMSYVDMYKKLETEYKRYIEDQKLGLKRTDEEATPITWIQDLPEIFHAMKEEAEVRYYPETLYSDDPKDHKARSKADLIADLTTRFPAWEIHLLPQNSLLARKGSGKTIGDRPVFESNIALGDYLEVMKGRAGKDPNKTGIIPPPVHNAKGHNVYRGEVGLIPEVWVSWALEVLYTKNQVLHDVNSILDAAAMLMGILTKDNRVAVSYFFCNLHRVVLLAGNTAYQVDDYAGVSSVKV